MSALALSDGWFIFGSYVLGGSIAAIGVCLFFALKK